MAVARILSGGALYSVQKSLRLRPVAREAALKGLRPKDIAKVTGVSLWMAETELSQVRKENYPSVTDGKFELEGETYFSIAKLGLIFGLSGTGLNGILRRAGATSALGRLPRNGCLTRGFTLKEVRKALRSSSRRARRHLYYQEIVSSVGVKRYHGLSAGEMAVLLILIGCLRDGYTPTYAEINNRLGPERGFAHHLIPGLVRKGYLTQIPVLNPKRGQQQFRYLIHRGPIKLVTQLTTCPGCDHEIAVAYPWYQPRQFAGNGTGK